MTRTRLILLISGGVIVLAAVSFLLAQKLGWLKLSADLLPNTDPNTIEEVDVKVYLNADAMNDARVTLSKGQRTDGRPIWSMLGAVEDVRYGLMGYVFTEVPRYQGVKLEATYQKEGPERTDCMYYSAERTIDIPPGWGGGNIEDLTDPNHERVSLAPLILKKTLDKENGRIIFKAIDAESGQILDSVDFFVTGRVHNGQWQEWVPGEGTFTAKTDQSGQYTSACIFPTKEGYNKFKFIAQKLEEYEPSQPVEVTIHPGDNYVQFLLKQKPEEPGAETSKPGEAANPNETGSGQQSQEAEN